MSEMPLTPSFWWYNIIGGFLDSCALLSKKLGYWGEKSILIIKQHAIIVAFVCNETSNIWELKYLGKYVHAITYSSTHRILYQKESNREFVYDAHYFNSLGNKVARFWCQTIKLRVTTKCYVLCVKVTHQTKSSSIMVKHRPVPHHITKS